MNAKQMISKLDGYGGIIPFNSEELDVTLRALRLLAAAEANDGTGCELIENLRTEADLCRNETATDIADLLDDAASALIATGAQFNALKDERNGLAARVGELEKDAERYRWLRDYGNYSPSDFPAIRIQEGPAWACTIIDGSRADAAIDAARSKP